MDYQLQGEYLEGRTRPILSRVPSQPRLLQDYWRRFQIAHGALLEDAALLQDDYFTENFFATVELEYTSSLGFLYDEQSALAMPPVTLVVRVEKL